MGEVDEVTERIFAALDAVPRAERRTRWAARDRGSRSRRPTRSTRCGGPAWWSGETLELLRAAVRAGVTTGELDAIAEDAHPLRTAATPSFLGYARRSRRSICTSVNDEVVHGIPGDRVLREGDVISIDCGAIVDGWHGDAAITVPVGDVARRGRPR